MSKKKFSLLVLCFFCVGQISSQSFYKQKNPKTFFYTLGLGGGTFFASPRPSYDSIINEKMPVLSIGIGKRVSEHLTLKSTLGFQPFSSAELTIKEDDGGVQLDPIFQGYNYALDITPIFNLIPTFHHMSRPIVDIQSGIGLGYLLTYRTEKFTYQDKKYEFSFFESSFYIPVRISTVIRLGILSDLELEGSFFYTFLNDSRTTLDLDKDSDHFGQLNLSYRRYFR